MLLILLGSFITSHFLEGNVYMPTAILC